MKDDLFGLERREYVRFEVEFSLKFQLLFDQPRKPFTDWLHGMIENLSLGGLRFNAELTEKQIEILTNKMVAILVDLKLPGKEASVKCDAVLRFFQRGAADQKNIQVDMGVEFTNLTEQDQNAISQFLQSVQL